MELKDKIDENIKSRNISANSIFDVIKYSLNGIASYAKEGKSIIIYITCSVIEIILGFLYRINGLEWILVICILGFILSIELVNTSIEKVCDAVTKEYNPLIRIAKDCGSAATFVIFIVAIILNIIIFAPKIYTLFM